MDIGDGHFTVNGHTLSPSVDSPDDIMALNGNAEIFGDQIRVTLNGASSDANFINAIAYHIKLSAQTLGGTFEGFGSIYSRSSEDIEEFAIEGTSVLADCPTIFLTKDD